MERRNPPFKHTWRVPPEDVAEFCAQVNRFAETYCADMERIRVLGLAGDYQAANDIVIKLEKVSRIIGMQSISKNHILPVGKFSAQNEISELIGTHAERSLLARSGYATRYALISVLGKKAAYQRVLDQYNAKPNGADFVYLCRACYGGVVRFRKADGFMSTPCGAHDPNPVSEDSRVKFAEC